MAPNNPPEENLLDFQAEVEAEFEFLKQFPVLDQTERFKAENLRKIERAERRKELRKYKGPPIVSDEAMEAENKRQHELRKQFNQESARWSKVKKEAEIGYQEWLNPILMKMSDEADLEMFDLVYDKVKLRDSITKLYEKNREIHASIAGNGSTGK